MADPNARDAIHALHHVLRRQILRCLEEGDEPRSPSEIAKQMQVSVSKVSYHMNVLRGRDAVVQARRTAARGAVEPFYRSMVPGNLLVEELLRVTEAEDEDELPRHHLGVS